MTRGWPGRARAAAYACWVMLVAALIAAPIGVASADMLTTDENLKHQPNELGRVPIFMYHNIVPNDYDTSGQTVDAYMFRTYDQFWNDMLWLYEHNFHLVGIRDVLSGDFDIPAGKHPIVFTFDDASSLHFSFIEEADGTLTIDPNCAVGLMERFHEQYPDFGRGAHFAMVPGNKFSWPGNVEDHLFYQKIEWLMENGYEIGNHTQTHPNLEEIDAETFKLTVGNPIIWGDTTVGRDHPLNLMRVLTLPFGIGPRKDVNPENWELMHNGFEWEGEYYQLEGVLQLNGGSSVSPWDDRFDSFAITRFPVDDENFNLLKEFYADGSVIYFTSDGDPDLVTVPWPLPESQFGHLKERRIEDAGKTLVKYDPETGQVYKAWSDIRKIGWRNDH